MRDAELKSGSLPRNTGGLTGMYSSNKTDSQDITKILFKVALNTNTTTPNRKGFLKCFHELVKPKTIKLIIFATSRLSMQRKGVLSKTGWVRIRIMCLSGATCLHADCFSELILYKYN